jgi:heat shock protein HtpX
MGPHLDLERQRAHRRRNRIHSAALLAGIGAVVAVSAWLMWGSAGVLLALATIAALAAFAPRLPHDGVMRLYRARRLDPRTGGQLLDVMSILARRAELPAIPDLYIIPSSTLNAFATGAPSHAAIGITEGLLRRLTLREIVGVLAHEVSHIRNNDLWVMGLADVMTRFTQSLSLAAMVLAGFNVFAIFTGETFISWTAILLLYFAPAIASLLQLGLSRSREYDADLEAAMLTGDAAGLASALRRLERLQGSFWEDLMYPVPGRRLPVPSVLRTHPPTEDRVARLLELQGRPQRPVFTLQEAPMRFLVGVGPIEMQPRYRWPGVWF